VTDPLRQALINNTSEVSSAFFGAEFLGDSWITPAVEAKELTAASFQFHVHGSVRHQ
jgi:hypothetical protein